ncbi:MAG: hypothetical protein PVI03_04000 [Candidatus Thorarchaeota archaeon]|jgi:hypothetical protein
MKICSTKTKPEEREIKLGDVLRFKKTSRKEKEKGYDLRLVCRDSNGKLVLFSLESGEECCSTPEFICPENYEIVDGCFIVDE